MKKVILLLFVSSLLYEVNAYDKCSLVERFTNCSCGPCATLNNVWYNATTANLINQGKISHIVYNVNWPGANDPMYLLNSADNMTRRYYYGVSWVPWIDINGTQFEHTLGQANFVNTINNGNVQFAPFNIVITPLALGATLIEVGIKIIRDPTDVTVFTNTKLQVALTEKTVSFASPPGSNGEKDFFSVCRKMLPDGNGSTFTLPAPGDFVEVILNYIPTAAFLAAVNLDSIRVVAFIQDNNTKMIYQSAMKTMNVIPVEFSSFTAENINDEVVLKWQTATETNNRGFEILRSSQNDLGEWQIISFLEGRGTTTEITDYNYGDKITNHGKYIYRLKQIDFDGTFSYSEDIEIDITGPKDFTLYQNYPNPFNPTTTIKFALPVDSRVKINVYNTIGQLVETLVDKEMESGYHEVNFDASRLTSGVYLYQLQSQDFVSVKKMLLIE